MPLILKKAQQTATPKIEPYSYDSFEKCFFYSLFCEYIQNIYVSLHREHLMKEWRYYLIKNILGNYTSKGIVKIRSIGSNHR